MTWLFSKALMDSVNWPSSPEPVEGYSAATYSDGGPSAQWNVMPTPQGFWRNDKMIDASRLSQFGPTLRLLTEQHGEDVLTSFLAGFPARTYPQPDEAKASAGQGPAFGLSSLESLAKYDPDTSTWRTPQFSLLGDWDLYSETWPRWGLMRNGECWVQPTLALRTSGTESGLWPTPNVPNGGRSVAHVTEWSESGRTAYCNGKKVQVGLESAVRLWPTPTVCGNHNKPGASKSAGWGLSSAVKLWPTPTAMNNTGGAAMCKWGGSGARKKMKTMATPEEMNGPLNPMWVEWLMGWPQGWTDLKPLETAKFQEWLQQHSPNWLEGSNAA